MPSSHRTALARLRSCGTEEAGRVFYQCPQCEDWLMAPASCGHRACNACGHHKAVAWQAQQQERLLPVNYVLVTFTVPAQFRDVFRAKPQLCYDLLFKQSAATLQEIAADPKHLGGAIGMTGVLHTWTRDLNYHPHIHFIVPAGALRDGRWIDAKGTTEGKDYFLNVHVLATRMRNRMLKAMRAQLPAAARHRLPTDAWRQRWNVQIQHVGTGETALGYLARYVQKTAVSKSTITACDSHHVTISYLHRESGQRRTARLTGHEFIRRFLQHVLPRGFSRVRHFGFLSYAAKRAYASVQAALAGRKPALSAPAPPPSPSDTDPNLTPEPRPAEPHQHCCPRCQVVMKFAEFWHANRRGRGPPGYAPKPGEAVQRQLGLKFSAP